ncbi:hypothetical protein PG994_002064 [Apiospora phragmitis]|uniref:Uncharacterized protein n=1 Tax=Apiospora phragmitis TaxID=2905665 RepID=A0ABR1WVB2_9PEZI
MDQADRGNCLNCSIDQSKTPVKCWNPSCPKPSAGLTGARALQSSNDQHSFSNTPATTRTTIVAVAVDVDSEKDSVFYARYLCRVWLDCCDFDLRFLEQPTGTRDIRTWLESIYREKGADNEGLPPAGAFVETKMDQQWCIM